MKNRYSFGLEGPVAQSVERRTINPLSIFPAEAEKHTDKMEIKIKSILLKIFTFYFIRKFERIIIN